jgi:transposase-like protein
MSAVASTSADASTAADASTSAVNSTSADAPTLVDASTSAVASTSSVLKRSRKRKKDDKAQFKKSIVKQCVEDLISPAKLAKMHNINSESVRHWVKNSGLDLPKKYELYDKPSVKEPQPSTSDNQTSNQPKELIINPKSKGSSLSEASLTDNHVDLQKMPKTVTSQGAFLCPKCDHKGSSQYHLDMHIEGHQDCSQCEMTFSGLNGSRDLANHIKKHEREKKTQFKCEFCKFEYKTKQTLNRHQTTCKKKKKSFLLQ